MTNTLKILNTNLSNLQSIKYAVENLGYNTKSVSNVENFHSEDIVIIPGVGHYGQAMENLKPNFVDFKEIAEEKNLKILGICLGMQLLFSFSEEGNKNGLDLIPGSVKKLDKYGIDKIPNIGWRKVSFENNELEQFAGEYFYFVHSYSAFPKIKENILGTTKLEGNEVTAIVSSDNNKIGRYVGCQFHPEKSGNVGLSFLEYILNKLHNI